MKYRNLALAAGIMAALSSPSFAESRRIMGGSAGGSRYQFFYDTFLDPSIPELGNMGGGTIGGDGVIHRFISDRRQRVYFGYDVAIESLIEPNTFRISFSQLTPESVRQILGDDAEGWTELPAPDWGGPAIRVIRSGEVLSLDLLTNNTTGQRIVDYVTVKGPSFDPSWDFIYETGEPQDFHVEDAALELRTPSVSVNGQTATAVIPTGIVVYGPAVWFYAPMRGRFILSLAPHPELGFVKAGEVRGSTLAFTAGGDSYSLVSASRIAPGRHPFNLYVLAEPDWRPPDSDASLWAGGAASAPQDLIGNGVTRGDQQ